MRQTSEIIRNFWVCLSLFYQIKFFPDENIILVEDENITENDKNKVSVLNEFFFNIIATLGIL